MADHDGYRSPRMRPQPNAYETSDVKYPPPPGAYSQPPSIPSMPDLERQRTREQPNAQHNGYSNDTGRYHNARQPINDAVTSAFSTTENTSAISAELLNAITANVIQQLQASNMAPPQPQQAQSTNSAMAASPSTTGSPPVEHRKVYTPPSPYRASEEAAQTVSSPTRSQAKTLPTYAQNVPPLDQRSTSPLSQAEDSDAREDRPSRPRGPKRLSTSADPSILERIWGTLFNEQGTATKRLGQFLRGIAVHLIEDYEPKHSLIITPDKMQKYYEDTKLPNELYPWQIVFDDRSSSISRLYREVEAQHHLVQERLDERPDTPGLTPLGFERWATLLLLAHPDLEFARLQKTALDMPISNPDDKKERFPKEISRRLFPQHEDAQIVAKLQKAMITNCNITISSQHNNASTSDHRPSRTDYRATEAAQASTTYPLPPSNTLQDPTVMPAVSRSTQPAAFAERERKPYSNPPLDAAVESTDDEDNLPTPQPIERERKPYIAQPGGGKMYDSDLEKANSAPSQVLATDGLKLTRSSSIASSGRQAEVQKSRPIPITVHQRGPPNAMDNTPMSADSTRHRRSNSIYNRDHGRPRVRSPSAGHNKDYGHRSEDFPSSYHSTSSIDPRDRDRDEPEAQSRRYRDYERERERLANDRFDAARMAAYDPREREREREPRQRFQSTVGLEAGRGHYLNDEEYYRAMGGVMGEKGVGGVGSHTRDGYTSAREGHAPHSYR